MQDGTHEGFHGNLLLTGGVGHFQLVEQLIAYYYVLAVREVHTTITIRCLTHSKRSVTSTGSKQRNQYVPCVVCVWEGILQHHHNFPDGKGFVCLTQLLNSFQRRVQLRPWGISPSLSYLFLYVLCEGSAGKLAGSYSGVLCPA